MEKKISYFAKGQHQTGFTLIEVIMVMVVIGVLAAIAVPSFRGFTNSSDATTATTDLVSAFNLARSEAVTRGVSVTVCKSGNQTSCDTAGTDWEQGWIVFVDNDGGGTVNGADAVIRAYQSPGGNVVMTASASLANRVTYANTGFRNDSNALGTIAVSAGNKQFTVEVNAIGRVRNFRP